MKNNKTYTGYKDINNKKIYKGDIIQNSSEHKYRVLRLDRGWGINPYDSNDVQITCLDEINMINSWEVVGNIYEKILIKSKSKEKKYPKNLQEKGFKDFPLLFPQKKETGMGFLPIVFGWETGTGWHQLIYELCKSIQHIIDRSSKKKEKIPQVEVVQIKEKFGGLRFYYNGGNNSIDELVCFAEDLSYKLCEQCGSMNATTSGKHWLRTLCPECKKLFEG